MKNNEHKDVCKTCMACCKGMGCEVSPVHDFENGIPTKEKIIEMLISGRFIFDWWEGDVTGGERGISYYMRAKNKNESGYSHGSWGGECINFSESSGCSLSWRQRPYGGKALIVNTVKPGECSAELYSKEKCAIEWYPYNTLIREILDELED